MAYDLKALQGLPKEEQEYAIKILKELNEKGTSLSLDKLKYEDYDEIPVGIHTFMHDKNYLGNALYDSDGRFTIYPYWEKILKDLFPTNTDTAYNTLVLTGAIGLGKSTIAVICMLYLLYRLLCLKDPYLYYGLQPIDKISISLMNITLDNAKGVALDKLNQMILSSTWFMSHGEMKGTSNLEYVPNKHIEVIVASSNNQIIGRCIYCNFTDEVNFGLTNDVEKLKQKQKTLISQIDARMKSRFMRTRNGKTYLPTLNIIASSKNSDQSFLDDYINTKRKNESKTTLIVDEPQWVVDSRKDSKEKFYVALGNKFLADEVLPLNAPQGLLEEYEAKGYKLLAVPVGYYDNFIENLDGALQDIAGLSTQSSVKFISGMRWNEIKTKEYENPFTKEILEVGDGKEDTQQYSDFFDLTKVSSIDRARPLYIHLDMSLTGDKTGIGGVYVTGKRPTSKDEDSSRELFYKVAFVVSIKAPKGYQVSFEKNRNFIRWLRANSFNIKGVSCDTFQSAHLQQLLRADNFNVDTLSVDRLQALEKSPDGSDEKSTRKVCLPYQYFKSAVYERKLQVFDKCKLLTEEVIGLEKMSDGHIQHQDGGKSGSKDSCDAITGSLYNASLHAEEFGYEYGESLEATIGANNEYGELSPEQITVYFEKELNNIHDPFAKFKERENKSTSRNNQEPTTFVDYANSMIIW